MKKYTNGKKEIQATDKMYQLIYKEQGFVPLDEWVEEEAEMTEDGLDSKSIEELKALCDEKGIEYKAKIKREELVKLLESME